MPKLIFQDRSIRNAYFRLAEDWQSCQRCPLAKDRYRVVQVRGRLPADVLFIGEAPGTSEDVKGFPFVGPAGSLLDDLVLQATIQSGASPSMAVVNVVGCIPKDADGRTRPPKRSEAEACRPRLEGLMGLASPKLLVCLGATAKRLAPKPEGVPVFYLPHPAAILRQWDTAPVKAEEDQKRFVLNLSAALEPFWVSGPPRRPSAEADDQSNHGMM